MAKVYVIQQRFVEENENDLHECCNSDIVWVGTNYDDAVKYMNENVRDTKLFYRQLQEWKDNSGTFKVVLSTKK